MKLKAFALILSLSFAMTMTGWAQDTPATSATPKSTPAPKAEGCCHHNMADMKGGKSCCHQAAADAKDTMSCCGKDNDKNKCEAKDGKSCCAGKDMKAEMKECKKNGCCEDGKSCGGAKSDKTATGCCGNKCQHHQEATAS